MRSKISEILNRAIKDKEKDKVSVLRMVMASIKDRDIAIRLEDRHDGINDGEISALLMKMIKQRRESIESFKSGGREDLVAKETYEVEVISHLLPEQMSEEQISAACEAAISELSAQSLKDMKPVIEHLRGKYASVMDMAFASDFVKRRLSGS